MLELLRACGAVEEGHFVLATGRHCATHIQCARVFEDPSLTRRLAEEVVARLPEDTVIDIVAAPAVGGIVFGFSVAEVLDARFVYSERVSGAMTFRRSFKIPQGSNVLICEDRVTTGGSVKEVCDLVTQAGGNVVGVASIIASSENHKFTQPFWPLLDYPTETWSADGCGLCRAGIDIMRTSTSPSRD